MSAKDFVKKEINCLYSLDEYVKLTPTGLWDKRNMDSYDALVCALYENKIISLLERALNSRR